MNRLVINDQGFVDLRRNPPAEKDQVNGWTPENGEPAPKVETVPVEFPKSIEEPLPAIQKTAEGLDRPEAPVRVEKSEKGLKRIVSANGPECYALVTPKQFEKLGKFEWSGTRGGKMFRRDTKPDGTVIIRWLHREAARVFRNDRFVVFRNNDERLLIPSNLLVVASKERMHEMRRHARLNATGK